VSVIAIALTFGVVFPPLGLACVIALFTYNYVFKLEFSYIVSTLYPNRVELCIREIEKNFKHVNERIRTSVFLLIPLSCMLIAFFIFDAVGDELGFHRALWAPLVVSFVAPVAALGVVMYCEQFTETIQVDDRSSFSIDTFPDGRAFYNSNYVESPMMNHFVDPNGVQLTESSKSDYILFGMPSNRVKE
jgi:hypothetical protein